MSDFVPMTGTGIALTVPLAACAASDSASRKSSSDRQQCRGKNEEAMQNRSRVPLTQPWPLEDTRIGASWHACHCDPMA